VAAKSVDDYISGLPPDQAQIVTALRALVRRAAPDAQEAYKWAQPVYESNGPFCYIKAFKPAVNFGFWRGVDLDDPGGRLEGSGDKMRHVKIIQLTDIDEALFTDFVQQAVRMNAARGDPSRKK
jgi:hypothetical protein